MDDIKQLREYLKQKKESSEVPDSFFGRSLREHDSLRGAQSLDTLRSDLESL